MRALIPLMHVTIGLVGASVLSGCATYGDSGHCRDTACAVEQSIRDQRDLAAPNQIYAQTMGGTVYLSGQVTTDVQRDKAERIARQVSGGRHLVDNLVVTADSGR